MYDVGRVGEAHAELGEVDLGLLAGQRLEANRKALAAGRSARTSSRTIE